MHDHDVLPSRRGFLAGLAGTSLAAVTSMGATEADAAGPRSGLPWASGCGSTGFAEFERYRGRNVDTITCWGRRRSWGDAVRVPTRLMNSTSAQISLGLAVLPDTHSAAKNGGNWRLAANGSFDGYYTQFARNLAASGRKNVIVRIGWETNHTFPWYGGSDPEAFKDTFQRVAGILRRYNSSVKTEWCNLKRGAQKGSVLSMYPGDDAVDIIGVDYYDGWPAINSERTWNEMYNASHNGGPWGIGAWLSFARSRGKKFSCAEWGIMIGNGPGTKDSPLYIEKMYEFFSRNAASIAYENYFNQKPVHELTPTRTNPKASGTYRKLWGR
jgi:hypothetical protein